MFYVNGYTNYDIAEIEEEFDLLEDAICCAERIVEEGGHADVFDENGNEYFW